MRLTEFRVTDYRCFKDSGWVSIEDLIVIVGKNEAGKTSLLRALYKFNPHGEEPYSLDREWPRGRRKKRSLESEVVTVRFSFNAAEITALYEIHESAQKVTGVEITKNYQGTYLYRFTPEEPDSEHHFKWVVSVMKEHFGTCPEMASKHFKRQMNEAFKGLVIDVRENGGAVHAMKALPLYKQRLNELRAPGNPEQQQDDQIVTTLSRGVDDAIKELKLDPPWQQAVDLVHEWLPVFIYMDDYQIFQGTAQLDQILERKERGTLTEEDSTIITIMELSGLELEEEVKKGNTPEREQRMLDMNDASQTLTTEIADRWRQKRYEVQFSVDGQHFVTFVKDEGQKVLVPLEERSRGFQWFFSFDMKFMYETSGSFKNAIILLDEPGLHLHAAAQRDLIQRLKAYSEANQLVYTTHLPFMIDFERLDNIWVCEEPDAGNAKVHQDWASADKDARFTLQAALGLSWSQSLFVGKYNLVVEGVTDFWYLSAVSNMLREAGEDGLDEELVVTPAGGGSKVAYIATILRGQELHVCALLDSDAEGQSAFEQLVHNWIISKDHVLLVGESISIEHDCSVEDLFDEPYYLQYVKDAYKKELNGKNLSLDKSKRGILPRVEDALKIYGIEKYNKGRAGKRIMTDLASRRLEDLEPKTVERFKTLIKRINDIVACWKAD